MKRSTPPPAGQSVLHSKDLVRSRSNTAMTFNLVQQFLQPFFSVSQNPSLSELLSRAHLPSLLDDQNFFSALTAAPADSIRSFSSTAATLDKLTIKSTACNLAPAFSSCQITFVSL
ncbi:conserved hypothetical protein [Trichinella spiralis]|uniref:hypothetical protein n=1 Tax=Trichinella spiralis TaxID=6334 RepID=UPI0001EFCA53|nr:conserved hypothetical protein [Trichinella spiralis]